MTPTILKLRQTGEPVLRESARALGLDEIRSPEIQRLIGAMRDTLRDAPGVGLAAPQVGFGLQLAIIEDRAEYQQGVPAGQLAERDRVPLPFQVIVNPKLSIIDPTTRLFFEGCLSVAGFTALVPRAAKVRVEGLDENGGPLLIEAEGWHARILQHEVDHLQGKLYLDSMLPRSFMTTANYARFWKDKPVCEVCAALGFPETLAQGAIV
ncbi:MAG: peptide deformylase [Proteobacteria bacterium]|nr:peptide deformylase [Pseudomonadota bacterium]